LSGNSAKLKGCRSYAWGFAHKNIYICFVEVIAEHINIFLSKCKSQHWAGVFFSTPFQTGFNFWLQDLAEDKNSAFHPFIFSPFNVAETPSIIIKPTAINQEAVELLGPPQNETDYWGKAGLEELTSTTKELYQQQFNKYLAEIRSGICSKAILSTILKGNLPESFNIGEYILKLRQAYPQAFVYVLSAPFAGTWIGATPETLLHWKNNEVETMSLAGTKRSGDISFNFGMKEKTEQEIVTQYIVDVFKKYFSDVVVDERQELKYGNMTHLLSKVKAHAEPTFGKEKFIQLAELLHPTPAVGGFPVKPALELIKKTEEHPRLYYSGFLGPVQQNAAELAVNLRCMTLADGNYYAFAGGGITADSDVEAEWEETRLKADALLKFL
jgi:isochorismate synthase